MLADGAHVAGGKLYILGGQWDRIFAAAFPAQHPTMAVALVIKIEYTEALDPHRLLVELTLDGQPQGPRAGGDVVTGHPAGQARGAPLYVPLALTFNGLTFDAPGRYEWVVTVGEDELGRLPIEVVQGIIPGMLPTVAPQPPNV